jgi:AhpC/TSA family
MAKHLICSALVCLIAAGVSQAAGSIRRVVIFDGVATDVTAADEQSKDLWVTMNDLTRATKFVVKPQGVCRDQLCFPIPKAKKSDFISKRGSVTWFNLSEFARLVKQPVAVDEKNGVWYFGARPDDQNAYLESLEAPNFTLPDMNGRMHSLSDFKGKKVLLVTWASW